MRARCVLRSFSALPSNYQVATLPPLPYALHSLSPVISEEIVDIHYNKHHLAYVNNYNSLREKILKNQDESLVKGLLNTLVFNYGGHVNHAFYWENLAPVASGGGKLEAGILLNQINKDFGSLEQLIEKFNALSLSVQGSGWGVLGFDKATGKLEIVQALNQFPFDQLRIVPLLAVDVWEHAYYLQYKNLRGDYLKNIWQIINWNKVSERFAKAL